MKEIIRTYSQDSTKSKTYYYYPDGMCMEDFPSGTKTYHYTTMESFINIVKNESLWLTNLKYSNDASEYYHGMDEAEKIIKEVFHNDDSFPKELQNTILNRIRRHLDDQHIYVFSATTENNLLSQWRAYTGNGGVAIGFNLEKLRSCAGSFILQRCIYDDEEKYALLRYLINRFERRNINQLIGSMVLILPTFKHSSFREENEIRLFSYPQPGSWNATSPPERPFYNFRAKNGLIIPYFEMPLSKSKWMKILQVDENKAVHIEDFSLKDLITEVWLGPSNNQDLSFTALRDFVAQYISRNCKVEKSDSPYILR